MSLYEILVVIVLAAAGGFAWHLYRSDIRSPRTEQSEAAGEPMFRRTPHKRADGVEGSGATGNASSNRRK